MIVPNQTIKVNWHYTNKDYYESKGYNFTNFKEEFIIKAEDILYTSHTKIQVQCDKCGHVFNREARSYFKEHDEVLGDLCQKCNRIKAIETCRERYGVDWGIQADEFKNKSKQTCLNKYGKPYVSQSKPFREQVKNTCLNKYGVENISQLDFIQQKKMESFYKNNSCPTSKQQQQIFSWLLEKYKNCELNYPESWYSLDCLVEFENIKIDIEYDGWYWHKDKQEKDSKRNNYLLKKGYKILRFKAHDKLPSKEYLYELVDELIFTDRVFNEIILESE